MNLAEKYTECHNSIRWEYHGSSGSVLVFDDDSVYDEARNTYYESLQSFVEDMIDDFSIESCVYPRNQREFDEFMDLCC